MSRGTKRLLVTMLVLLIILVGVIIYLIMKKTGHKPAANNAPVVEETMPEEPETTEPETTPEETTTTEPTEVDLPNEKEVKLYIDRGYVMQLVSEHSSAWSPDYDIAIFEAFNSDQQEFEYNNYYTVHEEVWNSVETATAYKIGYELSFDLNGENKVFTILAPKDITNSKELFMGDADNDEVTGYMGVWIYCDIGQEGIYEHLEQADMTADTLITSIKLRPTPQSDQISNVKLKVFSYSSDSEFNSKGKYIGTHGYEISVINENAL